MKSESKGLSTAGGAIILAIIVFIALAVYFSAGSQLAPGLTSSKSSSGSSSPSSSASLAQPSGNGPIKSLSLTPGAIAPGDKYQACLSQVGDPETCPVIVVPGPVIMECTPYDEGCAG